MAEGSCAMLLCFAASVIVCSALSLVAPASASSSSAFGASAYTASGSSPSTPPPPARPLSAEERRRGYRRFYANDSFIGRPVPCTHEQKLCFRFNLLYLSGRPKCNIPDQIGGKIADRHQFWHGSGEFAALKVNGSDYCFGPDRARMAYDDQCYSRAVVNEICGGAETSFHFLGGQECRAAPPTPVRVQQPPEPGRCRIPDLRFPDTERAALWGGRRAWEAPAALACGREQQACFAKGSAWVADAPAGCFPLLQRGPCPPDHVVAMHERAAREGRAEATCVHVRRGCPPGHVRLAATATCHSRYDLGVVLPNGIFQDQYGTYFEGVCGTYNVTFHMSLLSGSHMCNLTVELNNYSCSAAAGVPCHSNHGCKRYEVISEIPLPED